MSALCPWKCRVQVYSFDFVLRQAHAHHKRIQMIAVCPDPCELPRARGFAAQGLAPQIGGLTPSWFQPIAPGNLVLAPSCNQPKLEA